MSNMNSKGHVIVLNVFPPSIQLRCRAFFIFTFQTERGRSLPTSWMFLAQDPDAAASLSSPPRFISEEKGERTKKRASSSLFLRLPTFWLRVTHPPPSACQREGEFFASRHEGTEKTEREGGGKKILPVLFQQEFKLEARHKTHHDAVLPLYSLSLYEYRNILAAALFSVGLEEPFLDTTEC